LRTLLAGVLGATALGGNLVIAIVAVEFLAVWLGPGSAFGQLLTGIGLGLTESEVIGYLLGLLLVVALVYAFGLMVERGLEQGAAKLLEALVQRIPVVRSRRSTRCKSGPGCSAGKTGRELQSLSPVWLYFGGEPGSDAGDASAAAGEQGTAVLGFLSHTARP